MKNILLIIALGVVVINFNDKIDYPKENLEKINKKEIISKEEKLIIEENSEEKIVTYIENIDTEIERLDTDDKSIKEKIKNSYNILTDFIFHNGVINGITFDSLTNSAKEKVLSIYEKIDAKIENKFPDYKETIKNKSKEVYNNTKVKIEEFGQNIKEKYEKYTNDSKNEEVVEAFKNDKNNVVETYEKIKDKINSKHSKRGD